MKTILVTGSMGSGKSSVIDYLERKGYPVFRADDQAKKFLTSESPCYKDLRKLFPDKKFLNINGDFNRQQLAKTIFTDREKKTAIESLIHPLVQKAFKKFIRLQKGSELVFYEAPLLSQKIFSRFDKTILLLCPENLKKNRLIQKGWQEEDLKARWEGQIQDSKVLDKVDFILNNKGDLKQTYKQVEAVLKALKNN